MSYESPIKLITDLNYKLIEDQERNIVKAVCSYGIDISKDELFKLLYDDRKQYDKGYVDGIADSVKHGRWFGTVCSSCGESDSMYFDHDYCPNCGAKMDLIGEDKSHPFAESVMMGMDEENTETLEASACESCQNQKTCKDAPISSRYGCLGYKSDEVLTYTINAGEV